MFSVNFVKDAPAIMMPLDPNDLNEEHGAAVQGLFNRRKLKIASHKEKVQQYLKEKNVEAYAKEMAVLRDLKLHETADLKLFKEVAKKAFKQKRDKLAIFFCNFMLLENEQDMECRALRLMAISRSEIAESYGVALNDIKVILAIDDSQANCLFAAAKINFKIKNVSAALGQFYIALLCDIKELATDDVRKEILKIWVESDGTLLTPSKLPAKKLFAEGNKKLKKINKKNIEEAIVLFTQAIHKDLTNSEFYNKRSDAYVLAGKYQNAVFDLMVARWVNTMLNMTQLDPFYYYIKGRNLNLDNPTQGFEMSLIWHDQVIKIEKKISSDDKSLKVRQDDHNNEFAALLLRRGKGFLLDQEHDDQSCVHAIKYFAKSIELNPNDVEAYIALATAFHQSKHFIEARDILSQGERLWPGNAKIKHCRQELAEDDDMTMMELGGHMLFPIPMIGGGFTLMKIGSLGLNMLVTHSAKEVKNELRTVELKKAPIVEKPKEIKKPSAPTLFQKPLSEEEKARKAHEKQQRHAERMARDAAIKVNAASAEKAASVVIDERSKIKHKKTQTRKRKRKAESIAASAVTKAIEPKLTKEKQDEAKHEEAKQAALLQEQIKQAEIDKIKQRKQTEQLRMQALIKQAAIDHAKMDESARLILLSRQRELEKQREEEKRQAAEKYQEVKVIVQEPIGSIVSKYKEEKLPVVPEQKSTTSKLVESLKVIPSVESEDHPFSDIKHYKRVERILLRDQEADILGQIEKSGRHVKAFIIGGTVRARLWQKRVRKPANQPILFNPKKDVDIVTTATEQGLFATFKKHLHKSKQPGLYYLSFRDDNGKKVKVEIKTSQYKTLLEDLLSRNFTQLALPTDKEGYVYDPLNRGLSDIDNNVLDSIKPADVSFKEDPSRILQAQLNALTWQVADNDQLKNLNVAIQNNAHLIPNMHEYYRVNSWLMKSFIFSKVTHTEASANATMMLKGDFFSKLFDANTAKILNEDSEFILQELRNRPATLPELYMIFYVSLLRMKSGFDVGKDKEAFFANNLHAKHELENYGNFDLLRQQVSFRWSKFHNIEDVSVPDEVTGEREVYLPQLGGMRM